MIKEENPFNNKINAPYTVYIPYEKRETTVNSTYKLHIKNMEIMLVSSLLPLKKVKNSGANGIGF